MELLALALLFAVFSAVIASNKGRSAAAWFFVGLLFGPFGLIVGLLQARNATPEAKQPQRACLKCGEMILMTAKICKHCGAKYPLVDEPMRTHIELIERYFVQGLDPEVVAERLTGAGIACARGGGAWDADTVKYIIGTHVRGGKP
ncbi:hypothetical protein [Niveibacterium sp.]|uniref:hypothetical protein n=1 Tax=Niveibacterium sp. TaxID=2017444 RepID=UPI0035AF27DF